MKVLHIAGSVYPFVTGGKDLFCYILSKELTQYGVQSEILIHDHPSEKFIAKTVELNLPYKIIHLPPPVSSNIFESVFTGLVDELPGFEDYLLKSRPDIIHFHDQGINCSLSHLLTVKKILPESKTILTYHSPGQSCLQRSLMKNGKHKCSGKLILKDCTICQLKVKKIPTFPIYNILKLGWVLPNSNKIFRLLNLLENNRKYNKYFKEFYNAFDAIQVHSKWVENMLRLNNVKTRIIYFPLGGHKPISFNTLKNNKKELKYFNIIFIGRCSKVKGIEVLIKAIKLISKTYKIKISFFGPYWNNSEYGKKLMKKIKNDSRFNSPELMPYNKLIENIGNYDLCVVPSLWPETGPFVILDALAAGIPVLGSDYAGIRELAEKHSGVILFEWNNPRDLANKLLPLMEKENKLIKLKSEVKLTYTVSDMTKNMLNLYKE